MKKLYFAFILSILSICILSGCNKETSGNSGSQIASLSNSQSDTSLLHSGVKVGDVYCDLSFLSEEQLDFWEENEPCINMILYNMPDMERLLYEEKGIDFDVIYMDDAKHNWEDIEHHMFDMSYQDFCEYFLEVMTQEYFEKRFADIKVVDDRPVKICGDGGFSQPWAVLYEIKDTSNEHFEMELTSVFYMEDYNVDLSTVESIRYLIENDDRLLARRHTVVLTLTDDGWRISDVSDDGYIE